MLSDIEIANAAVLRPIREVAAETLGIEEQHLVPYGHYKAKVDLTYLASLADRPLGRLVLMTALSPTPPGEGKTTTTVGLTDALHGLGTRTVACLREPSMGPVFGMKGGAAGGGYSQVVPMTDINLHFTGDFAAIAAANNLLAALIDNHVHHGNELDIDVRSVTWKRVLDMNDRALRQVVVALGGHANGFPREDGFDIVVASELMAIFCLTESWADLKRRIGDIVIGYTRGTQPVTARDLGADGAMAALLRDALAPNLVQTLEGAPAFVHGGPFANIAHGCSSVMATRAGLRLADIVVTEAGFGADLGAEKFVDIKCRKSGLRPDVAVVVATVRALKYHGGVALADLGTRGPRGGRCRDGQPAPAPATTSARSTASSASSRSTGSRPTPTRRSRRSSTWWPPRACGPSRRPTSPTAGWARRTSRRVSCRRSTSPRRTPSRSPTRTTCRSPRRSRRSRPGCTAPGW